MIILSTLFALGAFLSLFVGNYLYQEKQRTVERQSQEVALLVGGALMLPSGPAGLISLMDTFDRLLGARVWLTDINGQVIITSPNERTQRGTVLPTGDMERVLAGETVTRVAYVKRLHANVLTVVTPVLLAGRPVGAVAVNAPLTGVAATLSGIRRRLALAAVLAVLLSAVVGYTLSRRIAGPVQAVTKAAKSLGQGDYRIRVPVQGEDELAGLGRAFNELAERLGRTVAALTREESQTRALLASVAEGVVAVDTDGVVLIANRPARQLLGWDVPPRRIQDFLHKGTEESRIVETPGIEKKTEVAAKPEVEEKAGVERAESVLWGCLTEALQMRREVRRLVGVRGDESKLAGTGGVEMAIIATPVQGVGDAPAGAVALLRDISEEVRQEQFRREFLATVSHELKTPLTSIRGFLQALYDGVVTNAEQVRHYYRLMLEETLRLTRLVNSLLDLSRIESGVVRLQPAPVDVDSLVRECVDQMLPASDEKGIEIEVNVEPALEPVWADRDRAKQVLINLLDNAIRHSPEGGRVEVAAAAATVAAAAGAVVPNEVIRISVRDHGPGIPHSEQSRVWERFYKVDKSRRRDGGGNGLGLYIVKELVELHGGQVGLNSEVGHGAEFWFCLPTQSAIARRSQAAMDQCSQSAMAERSRLATQGDAKARTLSELQPLPPDEAARLN